MVEIRLDGPGMNCIGTTMMTWLQGELAAADGRPVLLTGAGRAFSAGLDLKEVMSLTAETAPAFLNGLVDTMEAVYTYPGPVVGAVNGHAIAGGCVLALACDFAYATDDPRVRIGLNEIALGLRFPPRLLGLVTAQVPARHLDEVVLGAGLHAPAEAARLGLVAGVAEDPAAAAQACLARLARHPAGAYAAAKADLRGDHMAVSPELTRRFQEEVLPLWTSQALKDKVLALLER